MPDDSRQTDSIIAENSPIIPAHTAVETFRDSGYRDTASALAELIDNSIEAGADNIQIIMFEKLFEGKKRSIKKIERIAIYDDGCGMSPEVLLLSLQFAVGTRMKGGKGIGRFGIGLPNASVSQCRRAEVYSWQARDKCFRTYLDIDEIKEAKQQNANMPQQCDFPRDIINEIDGEIRDSGTIVVWSKCDRLDAHRSKTLYGRMKSLCRVYRHFLDDDDSYGKRVNIVMKIADDDSGCFILKANDPLYMLTPNDTPGYNDEPTNLSHCDPIQIEVPYNGQVSIVEMRFSVALPSVQELGGSSDLGKHYRDNTGISFVRACREIAFGNFGFFNPHEERERWWGCEIRFDPMLDDLFGVTNNKQSLRRIRYIGKDDEHHNEIDDDDDDDDEKVYFNLMQDISMNFIKNIKDMRNDIMKRGRGRRAGIGINNSGKDKSVKIANKALEHPFDKAKSEIEGEKKSAQQIFDSWKKLLETSKPDLSSDDREEIIRNSKDNKIHIEFTSFPGEQFFTIETRGRTQVVLINKRHLFYGEVYEPLSAEGVDPRISDALDLLMMAYVRAEDELYDYDDELEKLRSRWGMYVTDFLKEMKRESS